MASRPALCISFVLRHSRSQVHGELSGCRGYADIEAYKLTAGPLFQLRGAATTPKIKLFSK